MKYYPNYYETDMNKDLIPNPPHNKYSYAQYINSLGRLWCKENDVNFNMLVASLISAVLQGNIKVEKKDKDEYLYLINQSRIDRLLDSQEPRQLLYTLVNSYNIPLSDYDDNEFMLSYKNYLLDKLGGV